MGCATGNACGSLEVSNLNRNSNHNGSIIFASDGRFGSSLKHDFCITPNGNTIDELQLQLPPVPSPMVNDDVDFTTTTPEDTTSMLVVVATTTKCEDDRTFFLDRWNRDCAWIGRYDSRRRSKCADTFEGKKVSDACPATCGKCDSTGGGDNNNNNDNTTTTSDNNSSSSSTIIIPTSTAVIDICQDNPDFRFKTTNKNCNWIRGQTEKKHTEKKRDICNKPSNGILIKSLCPFSCGECPPP